MGRTNKKLVALHNMVLQSVPTIFLLLPFIYSDHFYIILMFLKSYLQKCLTSNVFAKTTN